MTHRRSLVQINYLCDHLQLITLLIGPNDFCLDMCYQKHPEDVIKNHERDLLAVFRTIRDNIERTMLNVLVPPCKVFSFYYKLSFKDYFMFSQAMKILVDFKGKPDECETVHHFECPCFFGLRFNKNLERYFKIMEDWKQKVIEVANREEFHNRTVCCEIFLFVF